MAVLAVCATAALARVGNPFSVEPEANANVAAAAPAPARSPTPANAAPASPTAASTRAVAGAPTATPRASSPTPALRPTTPASSSYTVRQGDSLTSVAAAHGLTVARLAAANNLPATARLRVNQTLIIPAP